MAQPAPAAVGRDWVTKTAAPVTLASETPPPIATLPTGQFTVPDTSKSAAVIGIGVPVTIW